MNFSQPPADFVWSNSTPYQQHSLQEKWYIYQFVKNSQDTKYECFRVLAKELGLSFQAIANKYYSIIK